MQLLTIHMEKIHRARFDEKWQGAPVPSQGISPQRVYQPIRSRFFTLLLTLWISCILCISCFFNRRGPGKMNLQGVMLDVPNHNFYNLGHYGRNRYIWYQVIQSDLGDRLQISEEFISYLNSEQATEGMDYTRLFYGRMERWFLLWKPSIAASGECRQPSELGHSLQRGKESLTGLKPQANRDKGMLSLREYLLWCGSTCCLQTARGQREGLGDGVYFPESLPRNHNLGKIFQNLPLGQPAYRQAGFWCHLSVMCKVSGTDLIPHFFLQI